MAWKDSESLSDFDESDSEFDFDDAATLQVQILISELQIPAMLMGQIFMILVAVTLLVRFHLSYLHLIVHCLAHHMDTSGTIRALPSDTSTIVCFYFSYSLSAAAYFFRIYI